MNKDIQKNLMWLEDALLERESPAVPQVVPAAAEESDPTADLDRELSEIAALLAEDTVPEPEPAPAVQKPQGRRRLTHAEKMEQQILQETDPIQDRSVPVYKKKGIGGLVFLAALEIIGILAIVGWWLQWLI